MRAAAHDDYGRRLCAAAAAFCALGERQKLGMMKTAPKFSCLVARFGRPRGCALFERARIVA